jgi:hypothetical protein
VTAFIIAIYMQFQSDSSDTNILLAQILQQFASSRAALISPSLASFPTVIFFRPREHGLVVQPCAELDVLSQVMLMR